MKPIIFCSWHCGPLGYGKRDSRAKASTPNEGSESTTLPSGITTVETRVKVEAVGNVFFSISPVNFTTN